MGGITPHIFGKGPGAPISLLELIFLVEDLQFKLTVAVSEPERRQGRRCLLLPDVLLELLCVKHLVDPDPKVSRQPPYIAAEASMQHFDNSFIFKDVCPDCRPDLFFVKC